MVKIEKPINKTTVTECSELCIDMGTAIQDKAIDDAYLSKFGQGLNSVG